MSVVWRASARADISRIVEHIKAENPFAARRIAREIIVAGNSLETFPYRGRPGIVNTRELVAIFPYVLVYRVEDGSRVTILRVWHGARNACRTEHGVGDLDPHGPGPRHHRDRRHPHRRPRLRPPESGLGGKLGMDATNKWPPETHRDWGTKIRMTDEVIERVTAKWASYGLPGSGKSIWKTSG